VATTENPLVPLSELLVCTVNTVEVVPGGVTVAGLNEQEAPVGRPEQLKLMA
jgi:hypothetical protein